jgi:hypothetical protein
MNDISSDKYKLIGLDQMEASIVRRHLHQWNKADEEAIRPLIVSLQELGCIQNTCISEPRWETNVYPLYYWARRLDSKKPYDYVFESLETSKVSIPTEELRIFVKRMVDSEIDILVEDYAYFVFIEAKVTPPGRKTVFQDRGGIRQIVRQYVQGCVLAQITDKKFCLATIGANKAKPIPLDKFSRAEVALLQLISDDVQPLSVVDLCWPITAAITQTTG